MNPALEGFSRGWRRMVNRLFRPFRLDRWLVIAFCAFLAECGQQAGSSPSPLPWVFLVFGDVRVSGVGWAATAAATFWLGLAVAAVIMVVVIFITWLSSRGHLLLIDALARAVPAIEEPWRRTAPAGERLFRVRLCLLAGPCGVLLASGLGWWMLEAGIGPPVDAATARGAASVAWGVTIVAWLAADTVAIDFLAPALYRDESTVREAAGRLWREVIRPRPGSLLLFYLLRVGCVVLAASIIGAAMMMTCCLLALPLTVPYVSTAVILPIPVFIRAWSLSYLETFGIGWSVFRLTDELRCPVCEYDLRGNPETATCPECGATLTAEEAGDHKKG